MSKFTAIIMIATVVLAIIIASSIATTSVYGQNVPITIQQTNYSNATTVPPIKGLNATTIIDAINTKIRSIYDDNNERSTNSVIEIHHEVTR